MLTVSPRFKTLAGFDGLMEGGRADRQTPLAAAVWKDTWPAKVRDGDEKAAA